MKIQVSLTEKELRQLVIAEFEKKTGQCITDETSVKIKVKSKQNYKSEWEDAQFKTEFECEL